ncbi:MAG TPA: SDR family NAD(P)-dependent oxidoreductase [Dehalococcoidales bacterium]|nr:SDR family NAD(P)-dependent oxidoreductase [Dehalococcoidales bacterium]
MAQRLKGKSAVVTGSGDGIGRGVALALAAEGAGVVINDIGRDASGKSAADRVAAEIKKAGGAAVASYDSVATMQGGENIIKTAVSNFGRIDILVNCAGNFKAVTTVEVTEDIWDSIIAVHLKGHFSCSKAAVKEMIKQKSGRIINISSRAAAFGAASLPYSAAKAGILGMTSMLSAELKQHGITVNVILPSAETKLFAGPAPNIGDNMPIAPDRGPEFIAPLIAYLATDKAGNITGRYFYASGGDICIYGHPFKLPGEAHMLVRKTGKWTLDELDAVIPRLLGAG